MPTQIVLAPVGAGKTETALSKLAETLDAPGFARVWVLLATKRQEDAFRQRLIAYRPAQKRFFNVEFFDFYQLYQRLLDGNGQPQRELSDTARYSVLRAVIDDLLRAGLLPTFARIAHTPGFLRIIADFIYELKEIRTDPEAFLQAAAAPKDAEIGLIYQHYQERLIRHQLVDREGQGWLAVDALLANRSLAGDLQLLIVDGYDQFTPVQADLLALLADRAIDTLITLTTVPGRETREGRRFSRTLERLQERFPAHQVEVVALSQADQDRHPDLQYLVDHIFLPGIPPQTSRGGVALIEAPEPAAEVGAVLRRIKRLLLEGCPPDHILIALRDWQTYQMHITALGAAYGLPLVQHYGEPIVQNPAVIALLNTIILHQQDFRRRDLLDVLRSPYLAVPGLTLQAAADLERISQEAALVGGREGWLAAIRQASLPRSTEDSSDVLPPLLTEDAADLLAQDMADFFAAVTPPPLAPIADYVYWLERLIGLDPEAAHENPLEHADMNVELGGYTLDVIARLRDGTVGEALVTRDLSALQTFKHVLRGLLSARELLRSLDGTPEDEPVAWEVFLGDLLAAVNAAAAASRPNRSGRVLVTTATNARGLPHQHVFILGLSEGLFPKPIPEDPLYLDTERLALRRRGILLQTQAERAADDGLFFELICLPRESLTLSRPTAQDGKPWIESHLWRAAARLIADAAERIAQQRLKIGQVVAPAESAALDEAAVGLAAALNQPLAALSPESAAVYNWMLTQADTWPHIIRSWQVEARRMSAAPHDAYTGRLRDPRLIAQAGERFASGQAWSATQLNDFGVCGFRYFAKRLLRLEALEEPEPGMNAAQRGSLNHDILERAYARIIQEGLPIAPPHLDRALAILAETAEAAFQDAPRRFGFQATALWAQEQHVLLRKLEALLRLDFSEKNPLRKLWGEAARHPYRLEVAFGLDPANTVTLPLDDGSSLRVRGFIDRIDRLGSGAVVIDYKTGSTRIASDEIAGGRNFQMMLYLLAAESLLRADPADDAPDHLAGGLFWHLTDGASSGAIHWDSPEDQAVIAQGRAHITRYMAQGRAGDFSAEANQLQEGKCVRYCEYARLCRVSVMHRRKRPAE